MATWGQRRRSRFQLSVPPDTHEHGDVKKVQDSEDEHNNADLGAYDFKDLGGICGRQTCFQCQTNKAAINRNLRP
ncbi:MAG: hypothetical protein L3J39_09285 [Verrucomicrobiales bacterium]|nr:hypothetical protein [Verrucomicrobiales bacterium]